MRSLWLPDEGLMPKRVGVTKCGDTDFTTTTSAKSIQNPNLCFNHCNAGWVFMELPLTSSASISFIRAVRSFPCTFSCSVCNFSSHWVISSSTYSLESGDTSAAVSSLWREMEEFWEKGKLKPGTLSHIKNNYCQLFYSWTNHDGWGCIYQCDVLKFVSEVLQPGSDSTEGFNKTIMVLFSGVTPLLLSLQLLLTLLQHLSVPDKTTEKE